MKHRTTTYVLIALVLAATAGLATAAISADIQNFEDGSIEIDYAGADWTNRSSEPAPIDPESANGDYSVLVGGSGYDQEAGIIEWTGGPDTTPTDEYYIRGTVQPHCQNDNSGCALIMVSGNTSDYVGIKFDTSTQRTYVIGTSGASYVKPDYGFHFAWASFNISIDPSANEIKAKAWNTTTESEPESWQGTETFSDSAWPDGDVRVNCLDYCYLDDIAVNADPTGATVSGGLSARTGGDLGAVTITAVDSNGDVAKRIETADGTYSMTLSDTGEYTIKAYSPPYGTIKKSVTVESVHTVDFQWGYRQEFVIDDRSATGVYDDATMAVDGEWSYKEGYPQNHNDVIYVQMVDDIEYDLKLESESGAVWTMEDYVADSSTTRDTIVVGTNVTIPENGTVTNVDDGAFNFGSADEFTDIEYTIRDENGTIITNGSQDFEDGTNWWSDSFNESVLNGSYENATVDWAGTFANGSTFAGSESGFSFDGSSGSVGIGPTGGAGASTGQRLGALAILAAGGYLAYRRFGNGQISEVARSLGGRFG